MNSPHQREQLPDLLSDALDDTQRARVESHLRECEQCARELRQLQQTQATIASLPAAPVPVSVRAGVRAALRAQPRSSFALPFAFPFPLRSRQIAWGGAAVAGAIGLMLLARPALQHDSYSSSEPVDETQLAARANQNGADQNGATAGEAVKPQKPQTLAPPAANQTVARSQAAPKTAARPEQKSAPKPVEQLPVLPPPPAPVVSSAPAAPQSPQDSAPNPQSKQPDFAFPDAPRPIPRPKTNPTKTRPIAPTDGAATAPGKSSAKPVGKPKVAPKTGAPAPKSAPPTPKSATDSANNAAPPTADNSESTSARSNAGGIAPNALSRARPAPALRAERAKGEQPADRALAQDNARSANSAQNSAQWPGGQIKATLAPRADTQSDTRAGTSADTQSEAAPAPQAPHAQAFAPPPPQPLILTIRVANSIGQARLILLTRASELTVWRGVLNDQSAQIELAPATLDKLRAPKSQTVRARLEQIDGAGNPKSSSTFEFILP